MKYRRKQEPIEAFQYGGDLKDKDGNYYVPDWAVEAYENGIITYLYHNEHRPQDLYLRVPECSMPILIPVGAYVMKCHDNTLTEYSKVLFEERYEPVGGESGLMRIMRDNCSICGQKP